jgi:protocatechuate 4,5-dioxygenase beta chain
MADLVAGFIVPHVPLMSSQPEAAPAEKRKIVADGFAAISRRLEELQIDTVVVIGDDHYTIFPPRCLPRCLIGIGEIDGPVEPWLGIQRSSIPCNESLAQHIMQYGFDHGVDWAVSKSLTLDHSVVIPYHYGVRPAGELNLVPIYLSVAVEPLISSTRARQIGAITGDAIRSSKDNSRVAILGTGGVSHWVGMAKMGHVNREWDQKILDIASTGDIDALIALQDDDVIRDAGNGALEIKNWIFAMAAMGDVKAEVTAYTDVPEWVAGFGFAELKRVAA